MNRRTAVYMLRKTLPPWKPHETIEELVRLMPGYDVEEVIFKIDTEEFFHGLPTMELLRPFAPWLSEARQKLAAVGVRMSINPWVTLVHTERGRDSRAQHPDIQFMVGHDGSQCKVSPCPLSPGWHRLVSDHYALYASTHPAVLWVEDDIRTFNHSPARWGCFCPLHLAEFERRVGQKRTREELVANILRPGKPHPDRKLWFDLLGDNMVHVAGLIEKAVHDVDPEIELGLMTSDPNTHAAEGRDWEAFCKALAGPKRLVVRPTMGNYRESNARGLYYSGDMLRRTVSCLPPPVSVTPEMESAPFTLYSKSCAFTRLQNALSFVLGADAVTMNMFDHCGTPIEYWPQYGQMLHESKPLMNALAERCRPGAGMPGIRALHHTRGADATVLKPGADYDDLVQRDSGWLQAIESLGMSITFQPAPVCAVTGQVLRAYSPDEVKAFLSQGILLDLSAAETLVDLGLGPEIGLRAVRRFKQDSRPLSVEEYIAPEFGGGKDFYSTIVGIVQGGDMGELTLADGARPVSMAVDPDRQRKLPLMTVFENPLGGRVAVYPFDLQGGTEVPFLNARRRAQMTAVLMWLGRGRLPLLVEGGVYPWCVRMDYSAYTIVAVANLSLDRWPSVTMTLSEPARGYNQVEIARKDGSWTRIQPAERETRAEHARLKFNVPIDPTDIAVFTLWRK